VSLANADIKCGDLGDLKLSVSADAKLSGQATFGIVASGTILPPKLKTFGITGGLDADVTGSLIFDASISVSGSWKLHV
jgi:hypothetical protein